MDKLLDEELTNDSKLDSLQNKPAGARLDFMGLETLLTQKHFDLQSERRKQDVECWQDLVQVMRDFMTAWEDLAGMQAKQRFLDAMPQPPSTSPDLERTPETNHHNESNHNYHHGKY